MTVRSERPAYVNEAEGKANELREQFGIGSDAIGDVFELLEPLGLEVVRWPMGDDGPDGFYVRKGDLSIVAVNSAKRLGRQRLTVSHELGHHLFDGQSRIDSDVFAADSVSERRANAFAAFFLLPRDGVRRWLQRVYDHNRAADVIDAERVVHLARHFGVSYQATLYQLRNLGRLNSSAVEALRMEQPERIVRRLGYSLEDEEAERGRRVLPPTFMRLALEAYAAGDISLPRLAELLRTDEATAGQRARDAGVEPAGVSLDELANEARRA